MDGELGMSAVAERLRGMTGRTSDVVDRVAGLDQAVRAADGRLPPQLVDDARTVVDHAGARLRLSAEHTVVALAGATGSGKSSLFNALCGLDLAAIGVRRPTTSWALACAWGPDGAGELLDWLGIPKRHQVNRVSMLDERDSERDLEGLVLLDLPDHDSTEVAHHLEVERLVKLADVLVWILDPQKYADAVVHEHYLQSLGSHADVIMVVFNHVDEIPPDTVAATLTDVKRLLTADGLPTVPVYPTSAVRGDGLGDLRKAIVERVAQKKAARERLSADVKSVASRLSDQTGSAQPVDVRGSVRSELLEACADAAGVPVVVEAIEAASVRRARQSTGWPVTKWLSRFRPDPLKRLHLQALSGSRQDGLPIGRSSVPGPSSIQRARVDGAVRSVADEVTHGMAKPWATAVRSGSVSRLDDVADGLDQAVARTDLGVADDPSWWGGARLLQWLLFALAVIGAVWLAALAIFSYLRLPEPPTKDWHGFALPTLLLIGGLVVGLLVAALCRLAATFSARRRAQRANRRLRSSIEAVTDELIVAPMQAEVDAYVRCRDGLSVALRR